MPVPKEEHSLRLGLFAGERVVLDLGLGAETLLLGGVGEALLHRGELLLGKVKPLHLIDALAVLAVLGVRAEQPVAPAERRREVVYERHVVEVVVLRAGPEGDDVLERPGEVYMKRAKARTCQ